MYQPDNIFLGLRVQWPALGAADGSRHFQGFECYWAALRYLCVSAAFADPQGSLLFDMQGHSCQTNA